MTTIFPNDRRCLTRLAGEARRLAGDLDRLAVDGGPCVADIAGAPRLDDWSIGLNDVPVLRGRIAGHPTRRDGSQVATGDLVAMDYDARWARSLTRWYALDVNPTTRDRVAP